MEDILLSIAVVTYNQEKYISKTLDSILNQKHEYSYEIIIGEDCSTDGTRAVIEEYVLKYPNIIRPLYNDSNMGIIGNYFNVIRHCHGKYIMECAGDDFWLPGKVLTQINYMEENKDVDLCYGNVIQYLNDSGEYRVVKNKGYEIFRDLLRLNTIPAVTVCFKRDKIVEYIKQVSPEQKDWKMEDYPLWLWISLNGKISYLSKDIAVYRVFNDSLSHFVDVNKYYLFIKNQFNVKNYFRKLNGIPEEPVDDNEILFNVCFQQIRNGDKHYLVNKTIFRYGKQIIHKTLKFYIKYTYLLLIYFFVAKKGI